MSGPGGYRGGFRGGLRGLRGGLRGSSYGGRGGYGRGGGYATGGRDISDQDLYKDYPGPDQQAGGYGGGTYETGFGGGYGGSFGSASFDSEPSQQIMVRNVSKSRVISDPVVDLVRRQLPWSTANEDLVELFETTGQVELAEILFDGTRSKGAGVVQFGQVAEAETAIGAFLPFSGYFLSCLKWWEDAAKFQQYVYGGRPLDVRFNDRWHTFTPTAAKGGQAVPMQPDVM